MPQPKMKIMGALAVLLAATACTATSSTKASPSPSPSSSPEKAVSLDTTELAQARKAASVLSADAFESGSAGLSRPTGNLDASLASGTRVTVQVACLGTGSMTVALTSGGLDGDGKHEVSEVFTCSEDGIASHTMEYRLAARGLMVSVDPAKGTRGGYAYALLKA
ncbi:hypothetical protein OG607_16685 [Streptomyces sp. NBC_01537]|uniref:hypothetical protein n=1 Tax=Streptomyces sp. NBC_01537 TaxID=2903896 RepID=UPI00386E51D3